MELKFTLADGKIKCVTHKIEWQETRKKFDIETKKMVDTIEYKSQECYSSEHKDALVTSLTARNIIPIITELEQPTAELLAKCDCKLFSSYNDALVFINGEPIVKTELQILQETVDALILASLEG